MDRPPLPHHQPQQHHPHHPPPPPPAAVAVAAVPSLPSQSQHLHHPQQHQQQQHQPSHHSHHPYPLPPPPTSTAVTAAPGSHPPSAHTTHSTGQSTSATSTSQYLPPYYSHTHPAQSYANPTPPPGPHQPPPQQSHSAPPTAPQQYHPAPPASSHVPATNQLPPINTHSYSPTPAQSDSRYRDSTAPPPPLQTHDPRSDNSKQSHSGHVTPAPMNRPYPHDSAQQRTPSTPIGPPSHFPPPPPQQAPHQAPILPPQGHPQQQQSQHIQSIPPQTEAVPLSHRQASMDHGMHPAYGPPNGISHSMPPPPLQHHQQHHHEPHPQYMPPMMESQPPPQQHHPYAPHPQPQPIYGAPPQYGGPTAGNMYNGPRRGKTVRATQACEQCRSRKQKCDEGNPCAFCKENNLACAYRDTPPAKTDKNMEKLFALVESIGQRFDSRMDNLSDTLHSKMRDFESRLDATGAYGQPLASQSISIPSPQDDAAVSSRKDTDHRVAPHKLLLLWPSIRPMMTNAGVVQNDSYVVHAEDRGTIRLWTRGEGTDDHDWANFSGPASPAQSDGSNEAGNAATPMSEGMWGMGFPVTPNANNNDPRRSDGTPRPVSTTGPGGLKANGDLDLDASTMRMLYESYVKHLHVMHPFLDKRRLWKSMLAFQERYHPERQGHAGFVQDGDTRPLKRQRSAGSSDHPTTSGAAYDANIRREVRQERSPTNCIIYLVLALGKICMHSEPLPPPVPDSRPLAHGSVPHSVPSSRNLLPHSPMAKHSPSSPNTAMNNHPTPPSDPGRHSSRSRRSSFDAMNNSQLRNIDVVPGLAYYAKAAEILGDQADGNELIHAQMFLLAGLYKGQLARVRESHSWYRMSGRAILYLCDRYKLYNTEYWKEYDIKKMHHHGQEVLKDPRRNQVVLAAWTSMQLESDVTAEMPYPSSGLLAKEDYLMMPARINEEEDYSGLATERPDSRHDNEDLILMAYSAQLYLRKRHNQIHRQLYGSECQNKTHAEVQAILEGHEDTLANWRNNLPEPLKFGDDDEPSSDILLARLQGKYWGGRYIINRPFVDYALHYMHLTREQKSIAEHATDAMGNWRHPADVRIFEAISRFNDQYIGEAVGRCVHAAMKSTLAFDGVMDKEFSRLRVTNIHGTAHAQFGNILVLSAVHECYHLRHYLDTEKFRSLITRTIRFLSRLAPVSPTLANDVEILQKVYNYIFSDEDGGARRQTSPADVNDIYKNQGVEPEAPSASTSFSGGPMS